MGGKKFYYLVYAILLFLNVFIAYGFVQITEEISSSIVFLQLNESKLPIDLKINSQGSDNLNFQQTRDALVASMERWVNISTSKINFTNSTTSLSATGNDGNFLLVFNETSDLGSSTIAATLISFRVATGEIVDADIEFNGNNFNFNVDGTNSGNNFDLESVATHEIGHLLGLEHATIGTDIAGVNVPEDIRPTMYPFAFNSGIKGRSLEKDDIAGTSFIYPETNFYTNLGGIKGNVTRNNGSSVFGANVVAINLSNNSTISSLSGYSTGKSGKGEYLIIGLEPGNYTIALEPLSDSTSDTDEANLGGIFSGFDTHFSNEFYDNMPNLIKALKVSINAGINISNINFILNNTELNNLNPTINSTDFLNRTNGTLQGFFTFNSENFGSITSYNETRWYNNSVEVLSFRNITAVAHENTTKGENWTFSVRVVANVDSSSFFNVTIHISNANPIINNSFPDVDTINIIEPNNQSFYINFTHDIDNDNLTIRWYKNSSLIQSSQNFNFTGNFSSAGFYNITADISDGEVSVTRAWNLSINNTNRAVSITSYSPSETTLSIAEPSNQTFNITYLDLDIDDLITINWYRNGTLVQTNNNFTFIGNFSAAGFYNVTVEVFDGNLTTAIGWNLTVNNTNVAPNITSVNLTNTDHLNRTNGTLQAFWGFSDFDGDAITANETLWYTNNTLIANYTNKTLVHPVNTTKLENWTFSVRVFDGLAWSDFANSSKTAILNAKPSINITQLSVTVQETQLVNISLNASDLDDDPLIFASNKTELTVSNNALLWHTNLTSSGTYTINVTVNDSMEIDSTIVNVTIIDARDLDNDGNPDFNETDDDNDGINDTDDFVIGNLSSINSTLSINLTINGTSNLSKLFNGTFAINITNGSDAFMEFNFTFNSSSILNFGNLTINRTASGSSAVSIRGSLNLFGSKKAVFLEKINTTVKAVCIKDADAGFDAISSACDSTNETLLTCDNATSGQYTCFDTGTRYRVTGLSHSAVKEQCRDVDGDGYGEGCALGTDDCDNNPSQHTSDGCNPSTPSSSSGSSGGGSGGGGGGGGGAAGFICNMDWKCSEWSECIDGMQTRQCEFAKVAQHWQETECPSSSNAPMSSQKCEMPKQIALAAETCSDNIKNQNEDGVDCGGICKPCAQEKNSGIESSQQKEIAQPTGFGVKEIAGRGFAMGGVAVASFIAVILIVFIGIRLYKNRQQ